MQAKVGSSNPDDDMDTRVRVRLRQRRSERGMTLESVARRADIDVSTLSRLESGKRRLALDHLPRLARALDTTVDELMRPDEHPDPRVQGAPSTHDGLTRWPLTRSGPAGGPQAYKIRISPRRRTPPAELKVHEGQDWMYVLSGRMRLLLGPDDLVIEPGEAVEFSTWTPHWFGVVDGAVELIALFGMDGQRLHLRS